MSDSISIVIPHLGDSDPPYLWDCIHQIRLWNLPEEIPVYLIAYPSLISNKVWIQNATRYSIHLVSTSSLEPTENHSIFLAHNKVDALFRNGYWKFVKERFFFVEELMRAYSLKHCIMMEYDILVYSSLYLIGKKLINYAPHLAYCMDTPNRGHPGFFYIASTEDIEHLNEYWITYLRSNYEDMQTLSIYAEENPEKVSTLPLIPPDINTNIKKRTSVDSTESCDSCNFLSDGFNNLNVLFDSLVVGQFIGGIDPRNTNTVFIRNYYNEKSLYSMKELQFEWEKIDTRWRPTLNGISLITIHMHSKDLSSFLSDCVRMPVPSGTREAILASLVPN